MPFNDLASIMSGLQGLGGMSQLAGGYGNAFRSGNGYQAQGQVAQSFPMAQIPGAALGGAYASAMGGVLMGAPAQTSGSYQRSYSSSQPPMMQSSPTGSLLGSLVSSAATMAPSAPAAPAPVASSPMQSSVGSIYQSAAPQQVVATAAPAVQQAVQAPAAPQRCPCCGK